MKQILLIAVFLSAGTLLTAQETLTGWTFPVNSGSDSLNANLGTNQNKGYDIRFEWSIAPGNDSTVNTVFFANGATTFAAATAGWDNGTGMKFWSIKFKANNYSNFKLSSKLSSDAAHPGPRDYKIQWRLSSTDYQDVPNGVVTAAADWTTGVTTDLPVPITDQGSSSIYIRWLMNSDTDINGGTVTSAGWSMIDDILVTGVSTLGTEEILYTNRLKLFPTPNNGTFTLSSEVEMVKAEICNLNGITLLTLDMPSRQQSIRIPEAKPGMYLLKVTFRDQDKPSTVRFIVE